MIRETSETFGIITKENRFRGITFFVFVTLTLVLCKKIFFCLHISSLFFVLFFGNVLNLILQIFITQYNFSTGVFCIAVVPKVGSVFIFQADCWKITLHGDKLSKRSTNKPKP